MNGKRLLVVQCAALGHDFLAKSGEKIPGLEFRPVDPVFPALTCTAQASFRTASLPSAHGMIANGFYDATLRKVMFWEQSSALVAGERIWSKFRARGKRVAVLFWQQSLGEEADLVLSPAPIHKHHGGMIEDCYSKPDGLYRRLSEKVGGPFKLRHYWGPMASTKSGDWIARATAALLADDELRPDLCLTYLPTLDYDLQRYGPADARSAKALAALLDQLRPLADAAKTSGYDVLVFGDYAIDPVELVIYPNRMLAEEGLFKARSVRGMLYPDFHESRAFAMVDHEVAHVYAKDAASAQAARECFAGMQMLDIRSARAGDFVLVAPEGSWFAYPWWTEKREAPDYAAHVDIHQKPGYDPCELFFGFPPIKTSTDASRIRGSHGRAGNPAAWASTVDFGSPGNLVDLARATRTWMEQA